MSIPKAWQARHVLTTEGFQQQWVAKLLGGHQFSLEIKACALEDVRVKLRLACTKHMCVHL